MQAVLDRLLELHAREPFRAEVGGRYGLDQVGAALRRLANREATGKQVVIPALRA